MPNLGDEFIIPDSLRSVANAIVAGDSLATLFYGPAGTGKTMSCKIIARDTKLPILATINCTENLDEFVLGKYIPVDGKIVFKESMVICSSLGFQEGWRDLRKSICLSHNI